MRKNWPYYLLVLIPAFFQIGEFTWAWFWYAKWFALACCLLVPFVLYLNTVYPWQVCLPIGYILAQCVFYLGFRDTFYSQYTFRDILVVAKLASYTALSVGGLAFLFTRQKTWQMSQVGNALGFLGMINAVVILGDCIFLGRKGFEAGGLFGNASMNACLMLSMTPLLRTKHKWLYTLPIAATLITTRTTPLILLSVMTLYWVWLTPHLRRKYLPTVACLLVAVVSFLAYRFTPYMNGDKASLFNDSGRFDIWRMGLTLWWNQYEWAGRLWGFGPGVSAVWLPEAQQETNTAVLAGNWLWWHNDYLQFLFDFGVLGCLTLVPLIKLISTKWRSVTPRIRISFTGLALSAAANYPLRMALGALLGAYLIAVITKKEKVLYEAN